jgi:hypothetical protein
MMETIDLPVGIRERDWDRAAVMEKKEGGFAGGRKKNINQGNAGRERVER